MSDRRHTIREQIIACQETCSTADPVAGPETYIQWLDWFARERLLATMRAELARVGSNHRFWIQSPASCH